MDTSVTDLALSASLDRHISTKAIRVTLGLHREITEALAKPNPDGPRTEAFIAHEYLEHLTGMNVRTISKAAALAEKQIGLVVRTSKGAKNVLMEGTNHGRAAGWALAEPLSFPVLTYTSGYVAVEFLDPANSLWSNNDRGYRTALVLVATHGMSRIETTTASVAALMGLTLPNATKHLDALVKAGVGLKTGRGQWTLIFDRTQGLGDTRLGHEAADRAYARRTAWRDRLAPKSADPVPDNVEPVPAPQKDAQQPEPTGVSGDDLARRIAGIRELLAEETRRPDEQKAAAAAANRAVVLKRIQARHEANLQRLLARPEPEQTAEGR